MIFLCPTFVAFDRFLWTFLLSFAYFGSQLLFSIYVSFWYFAWEIGAQPVRITPLVQAWCLTDVLCNTRYKLPANTQSWKKTMSTVTSMENLNMYVVIFVSLVVHIIWSAPVLCLNSLTPKISLVILFTVCHTVVVMLIWRIWYWINI